MKYISKGALLTYDVPHDIVAVYMYLYVIYTDIVVTHDMLSLHDIVASEGS